MKLSKHRDRIALQTFGFLFLFSLMIFILLNNSMKDSWFLQDWYHKLGGLSLPLGIAGMGALLVYNLLEYYEVVKGIGAQHSKTETHTEN